MDSYIMPVSLMLCPYPYPTATAGAMENPAISSSDAQPSKKESTMARAGFVDIGQVTFVRYFLSLLDTQLTCHRGSFNS